MKKIIVSLMAAATILGSFTSCKKSRIPVSSPLCGIYLSETQTDTSQIVLAPQGQRDLISIKMSGADDCVIINPVVTINSSNTEGTFSEKDWTGQIIFNREERTASLNMTNQSSGRQIFIPELKKASFGASLAGNWADPSNPQQNSMHIALRPLGIPDCGIVKLDGVSHIVDVYGPDSRYGNGTLVIDGFVTKYQLSARETDDSFDQSIIFTYLDKAYEMDRLYDSVD